MHKIVLGDALSPPSRALLTARMVATQTGDARLRAGLPKSWRIADQTGTGPDLNNAVNDIAVAWPPGRAPTIVTANYSGSAAPADQREFVLSQVARVACRI